ncbi:MAG: spore coat protein U domain-containing protein [Rickettsiales bacterium]
MLRLCVFLVGATFFCRASSAYALCLGVQLSGVPSTATFQGGSGEYNVYDPAEYVQTLSFSVGGGASVANCNYFVTLSAGQSGGFTTRKMAQSTNNLNYNVYIDAAKSKVIKSVTTATASEVLTGSFPVLLGTNQTNPHRLYWTASPGQVVPASASRYVDSNLTLSLYTGLLLGIYVLADSKTVTFQAKAESSIDLSLVDTGSAFALGDATQLVDFGNLESGKKKSFDLVVRSNAGYRVSLSSQNGQKLKRQNASDLIPYSLKLGGSTVNLSSAGVAVQALANSALTSNAGSAFPFEVTIGTLGAHERAGSYSDVVTATVSAY